MRSHQILYTAHRRQSVVASGGGAAAAIEGPDGDTADLASRDTAGAAATAAAGSAADVESWFPYDPYALPTSAPYIHRLYRQWGSDEARDELSESSESEDDRDEFDFLAGNGSGSFGGSGSSPLTIPSFKRGRRRHCGPHTPTFGIGFDSSTPASPMADGIRKRK